MKAIIDIKTPAGQSLEWFPVVTNQVVNLHHNNAESIVLDYMKDDILQHRRIQLHKADRITNEMNE